MLYLIGMIILGVVILMIAGAVTHEAINPAEEVIKVRYIVGEGQTRLKKIPEGDFIDLPVKEGYSYKKGDTVFVKFGVAMQLPKGYEAHIHPRSSTFKHYGLLLTNSVGVIDNSYQGNNDEWCAMFYATKDGEIKKGDRVCQFRIFKNQPDIIFKEVENLHTDDRGGYGSTGK